MGSLTTNIQRILVFYVTLWTIAPPLQLSTIYRLAALGAVVLWFLLDIPKDVKFEKQHAWAILFLLLIVVVALVEGRLEDALKPINYYMLIIAFLMAHCYKGRWDELSWMIPVMLLFLTYFNYTTYDALADDPAIARLIVRNDPEIYDEMRRGVGGYGLLYSQVCVFPVIVAWILNSFKYSKIRFAIGVAWLASYILYLLESGYTIATATTVAGLIILLLYNSKNVGMAIAIISALLVLMVWLIGYNDAVRNSLLEFFDGTTVAKKIRDIHESITTEETADSIMARIRRYKAALEAIIEYPVTGGFWMTNGGGHSAILDTLAKYGVFGLFVLMKMIFGFPNTIKQTATKMKDIKLANAFIVALVMINILNSLPYNFIFLIMIIAPTCYNDMLAWRKNDEDTLDSKLNTAGSGEEA